MPNRKHPEDRSSDTHMIAPDNSFLPPNTRMQIAFLQEAQRAERFREYRRIAQGYLDLARDTEVDAKQAARLLQQILDDVDLAEIALSTEQLIREARPAIQRALAMVKHKMNRDEKGRSVYSEQALAAAKVSSGTSHSELDRALSSFPSNIGAMDEQVMRFPEVSGKQRLIAAHSKTPGKMKEGAAPQLSAEVMRNLRIFAAGNAAMTLHDIDALMATLSAKRAFFESELEECKKITDRVQEMRDSGCTDEDIRNILEASGIENRVRVFQEMVLELEVALRIASARMKFVNQPDNKVLASQITPEQIVRLLREGVVDASILQDRRTSVLGALRRILPKKNDDKGATTQLTLRTALARRTTRTIK